MKVLICSLALCVLAASPVASGAGRPPQITCLNAVLLVMVGLGAPGVCAWLGRKVSRARGLLWPRR